MQYTSNYNLMLPEGTDTVNLLTQMNPNTSDIDAAMFANKQAVVGRATELTAGTVHAITRANQDSPIFAFTATSNWAAGDSMSVDGVACSVYLPDGTAPAGGAYVINSEVLAIIQGSRVTLFTPAAVPTIDAEDVPYDNTTSGLTATDVQAAIDELNAKVDAGDVQVTSDGVKTMSELLNALYSLIDQTKITPRSVFVFNDTEFMSIENKTGSSISFTRSHVRTNDVRVSTYILNAAASKYLDAANGVVTDNSTLVLSSGFVLKVVY